MKVLVVGPDLKDQGGVANYFNAVFPRLGDAEVTPQYLQIGSTHGQKLPLHILLDQVRLWRAIGRFQPDIVHLNPSLDFRSFFRDGLFIVLAKLRSKRLLIFFRGWQEPFEDKVAGSYKWFFNRTYAKADSFLVLARQFSSRLREWGITAPISTGTTAVANELLDGFSIDSKVESTRNSDVIRLLYLARLERDKGVLELISAVKRLLDRGVPVSLTIAGDGPVMSEVKQQVDALGQHKNRVDVVGYVRGQEKSATLCSHHVYCFPTQYGEGMPNSVLEAMAFGMPVVTCPVGGIADFFEDGNMGALMDSIEPEHLADAIESLVTDREQLASVMRYNHDYAQTRFLASTSADMLRARYREIHCRNHP